MEIEQTRLTTESRIRDFTFLSPSRFLIIGPFGGFKVYHFHVSSDHTGRTTVNIPTLLVAYLFPSLAPGGSYQALYVRCKPCAGYVPSQYDDLSDQDTTRRDDGFDGSVNQACPQTLPSRLPLFYPCPEDGILVCSLHLSNDERYTEIFPLILVVDIKAFLASSWSSWTNRSSGGGGPAVIPWEEWGPRSTRCFEGGETSDWLHDSWGSRMIQYRESPGVWIHAPPMGSIEDGIPTVGMSPWKRLRVRDFNPFVVKRALNELEDDGRSLYVSSSLDFLCMRDVFFPFLGS
jgi:hypothetical protein